MKDSIPTRIATGDFVLNPTQQAHVRADNGIACRLAEMRSFTHDLRRGDGNAIWVVIFAAMTVGSLLLAILLPLLSR